MSTYYTVESYDDTTGEVYWPEEEYTAYSEVVAKTCNYINHIECDSINIKTIDGSRNVILEELETFMSTMSEAEGMLIECTMNTTKHICIRIMRNKRYIRHDPEDDPYYEDGDYKVRLCDLSKYLEERRLY